MRLGFHGRLLGALVLTLAALGGIQYLVLSSDTSDRLYEEEGLSQNADAAAVARAYDITVPGEVPLNNVNRYLRADHGPPGQRRCRLRGPRTAAAGGRHHAGHRR